MILNITMYRLVFFTVASCLAVAYTADDFQTCMKLIEPEAVNSTCCKLEPLNMKNIDKMDSKEREAKTEYDKYDECNDLPDDGKQCSEKSICVSKQSGMMEDNGDINKEAVKDKMKEKLEPLLLTEVYRKMEQCVDDDLSKFDTDNSCYFEKLEKCMQVQYITSCLEWSDEKSCSEIKSFAEECAKLFS